MARRRPERLLGALGAVGGAMGVAAARCGGGCGACFACAVPALGLVVAALVSGSQPSDPTAEPQRAPVRAGDVGR
jgi:hypothetical protein